MKVYRTGDLQSQYINALIYGLAGAGKTPLAATLPANSVCVITSEPGLLSLRKANLPYVFGFDYLTAMEVVKWLTGSKEAAGIVNVFYDSISALSENILLACKKRSNDPRKFSPETTAQTIEVVKAYLTIQNKNVWMTCKATEITDQLTGAKTAEPFAVVPKLGPQLPYHFDEVLFLSRHRDANTGTEYAALRCRQNDYCYARDRSGTLDLWEPPDLSHIVHKITGR